MINSDTDNCGSVKIPYINTLDLVDNNKFKNKYVRVSSNSCYVVNAHGKPMLEVFIDGAKLLMELDTAAPVQGRPCRAPSAVLHHR